MKTTKFLTSNFSLTSKKHRAISEQRKSNRIFTVNYKKWVYPARVISEKRGKGTKGTVFFYFPGKV